MTDNNEIPPKVERLAALADIATAVEKWLIAENVRLAAENERLLAERERLKARLRAVLRAKGIENPN